MEVVLANHYRLQYDEYEYFCIVMMRRRMRMMMIIIYIYIHIFIYMMKMMTMMEMMKGERYEISALLLLNICYDDDDEYVIR